MRVLTRHDEVGALVPYDSIAWAYEVHLKELDPRTFNFAILHGNEDCPFRIQFWIVEAPLWRLPPDRDWKPQQYFLSADGKTKYLVSRDFPEEDKA